MFHCDYITCSTTMLCEDAICAWRIASGIRSTVVIALYLPCARFAPCDLALFTNARRGHCKGVFLEFYDQIHYLTFIDDDLVISNNYENHTLTQQYIIRLFHSVCHKKRTNREKVKQSQKYHQTDCDSNI